MLLATTCLAEGLFPQQAMKPSLKAGVTPYTGQTCPTPPHHPKRDATSCGVFARAPAAMMDGGCKHGSNVADVLAEDTYCPITVTYDLFHGVWMHLDFFQMRTRMQSPG